MDRREQESLDRYITGNYGEDQFRDEDGSPDRLKRMTRSDALRLAIRELQDWSEGEDMQEQSPERVAENKNAVLILKRMLDRLELRKKNSEAKAMSSGNKCFYCGRKLGKNPYVADTHEDQTVFIGRECRKLLHGSMPEGLKVPNSGLRLYVLTPERQAYFIAKFGKVAIGARA